MSKKNRYSPISSHKRDKSKLKTGLSGLLAPFDWERDLMPEHIWIDLLAEEYKDRPWHKIYEHFLDELEECAEEKIYLFGLISDFGRVPEETRRKFILHNKDLIYEVFYKPVGKILTLYPENPANWLILDEHKNSEKIDFENELVRLANSLKRLIQAKDLYAGHIRMIPLTRVLKHKLVKNMLYDEKMIDMFTRYSDGCTEQEKYSVQQHARVIMNSQFMMNEAYKDKRWPMYFWKHNLDLVPCRPFRGSLEDGDIIDNPEKIKQIHKEILDNCTIIIRYLDKVGIQYKYDLYDTVKDETLLGLFSRITRLFISLISDPLLWPRDLSGILLRCLGDTAITFAYLAKFGTREDFKNFYEYGRGKEKLLMLHLQDTFQGEISLEGKDVEGISKDLGGGFNPEMLDIELSGWIKKDCRKMAKDTGFEDIYKLVVDPASSDVHGSWTSLAKSNLVVCTQILHRFHKIPKFFDPPAYLVSLDIAQRIYFKCLNIGIELLKFPKFEETLKEIDAIKEAVNQVLKQNSAEQNS